MKIIFNLFIALIIFCFQLFTQEKTLIGDEEISNGEFRTPVIKYTQIYNEHEVLVGGRGGWIINHTFVLGGGGYGLSNQINADNFINGNQTYLHFGYGGLKL